MNTFQSVRSSTRVIWLPRHMGIRRLAGRMRSATSGVEGSARKILYKRAYCSRPAVRRSTYHDDSSTRQVTMKVAVIFSHTALLMSSLVTASTPPGCNSITYEALKGGQDGTVLANSVSNLQQLQQVISACTITTSLKSVTISGYVFLAAVGAGEVCWPTLGLVRTNSRGVTEWYTCGRTS